MDPHGEWRWKKPVFLKAYSHEADYADLYIYFDVGNTTAPVNAAATKVRPGLWLMAHGSWHGSSHCLCALGCFAWHLRVGAGTCSFHARVAMCPGRWERQLSSILLHAWCAGETACGSCLPVAQPRCMHAPGGTEGRLLGSMPVCSMMRCCGTCPPTAPRRRSSATGWRASPM